MQTLRSINYYWYNHYSVGLQSQVFNNTCIVNSFSLAADIVYMYFYEIFKCLLCENFSNKTKLIESLHTSDVVQLNHFGILNCSIKNSKKVWVGVIFFFHLFLFQLDILKKNVASLLTDLWDYYRKSLCDFYRRSLLSTVTNLIFYIIQTELFFSTKYWD
jgi:hypothetical protein